MWANQGWASGAMPNASGQQEQINMLEQQAKQYAAYQQQQEQQWQQQQQQQGTSPWMWGQPGMYGMYGMYGSPQGVMPMMSVPPPALRTDTSVPPPAVPPAACPPPPAVPPPDTSVPPPNVPPPCAPPPPMDPPPPPPPEDEEGDRGTPADEAEVDPERPAAEAGEDVKEDASGEPAGAKGDPAGGEPKKVQSSGLLGESPSSAKGKPLMMGETPVMGGHSGLLGESPGSKGQSSGLMGDPPGLKGPSTGLLGQSPGLLGLSPGVKASVGLLGEYPGVKGPSAGLLGEYPGAKGQPPGVEPPGSKGQSSGLLEEPPGPKGQPQALGRGRGGWNGQGRQGYDPTRPANHEGGDWGSPWGQGANQQGGRGPFGWAEEGRGDPWEESQPWGGRPDPGDRRETTPRNPGRRPRSEGVFEDVKTQNRYHPTNSDSETGNQQDEESSPARGGSSEAQFDEKNDEDLKDFDVQFANWEEQYMQWREENKNHPDKAAFKKYEEDWIRWRSDLTMRREDLRKRKREQFRQQQRQKGEKKPNFGASTGSSLTSAAPGASSPEQTQPGDWAWKPPLGQGRQWSQERGRGGPSPGNFGQGQQTKGQDRLCQEQGRGGFGQEQGRGGGFGQEHGRGGGFGQEQSLGGFGQEQGRGTLGRGFGQEQGRAGFGQEQGRSFGQEQGRGGFGQEQGRGGFGQEQGRAGLGQEQGRGFGQEQGRSFGQDQGRGGFGQDQGRVGFGQEQGRVGFGQEQGRDEFGQEQNPASLSQGLGWRGFNQGRGGFSKDGRGGFSQAQGRGSFSQDRGGFSQGQDRGGFSQDGRGGFSQAQGRGGFGQDSRGGFSQGEGRGGFSQGRGGFNQDRGGFSQAEGREDRGGFGQDGRDNFSQGDGRGGLSQGQGQGGFSQEGRDGFNPGQGRGGFSQDRGGFSQGDAQGGFNQGQGRGGFNQGQGRGAFVQGEGREGFNQDRAEGRGGFNQGEGRGGFNQGGEGRGSFNQGRGGFNQSEGRGGFSQERGEGRGGFNHDRDGFNQRDGRAGFNQGQGRGGFNQEGRGGFNQDQGGFNQDGRGGFDQRDGRGGFSQGQGRGGFSQGEGRGGFNQAQQGRGGFSQGEGRGGGFSQGPDPNEPDGGWKPFVQGPGGRGGGRGFDFSRGRGSYVDAEQGSRGGGVFSSNGRTGTPRDFEQAGRGGRGGPPPAILGQQGFDDRALDQDERRAVGGGRGGLIDRQIRGMFKPDDFDDAGGRGGGPFDQDDRLPGGFNWGRGSSAELGGRGRSFDPYEAGPGGDAGGDPPSAGRVGSSQAARGGREGEPRGRGGRNDQSRGRGSDQRAGRDDWAGSREREGDSDWRGGDDRWHSYNESIGRIRGRGSMQRQGDLRRTDEKQKAQEKGGLGLGSAQIPGLDLTESAPKGVEEKDASKERKSSSAKGVFHDQEDEKIDVKLGAEPLKIGPIGVPPQKQEKFTLPGDWYDDEEEGERKDVEGKEGGGKDNEGKEQRGKDKEAKGGASNEGEGKNEEDQTMEDSPKNMKSGGVAALLARLRGETDNEEREDISEEEDNGTNQNQSFEGLSRHNFGGPAGQDFRSPRPDFRGYGRQDFGGPRRPEFEGPRGSGRPEFGPRPDFRGQPRPEFGRDPEGTRPEFGGPPRQQSEGPPRRGFGEPDRPNFGDPSPRGNFGQRAEFGEAARGDFEHQGRDPQKGSRWQDGGRRDRQPYPVEREGWDKDGGRPLAAYGLSERLAEEMSRFECDRRRDSYPEGRRGDYWEDPQAEPRFFSRNVDGGRYRGGEEEEDEYYRRHRWDYYDERRGGGPPYRRDERFYDPYYGDYYKYGRGPRERPFGRDAPYGRGPFPYGDPDAPYEPDPLGPYQRDRPGRYGRGPEEPPGREAYDPAKTVKDQPAVVDYGHGGGNSGMTSAKERNLPYSSPMEQQGQVKDSLDQMSRDRGMRMGHEESRRASLLSAHEQRPNWAPGHGEERDRSPVRPFSDSRQSTTSDPSSLSNQSPAPPPPPPLIPSGEPPEAAVVGEVVTIDDLVSIPGRFMRPPKVVIVLRGPPGSGKTTMARMIKDREIENGGGPPRILSLDDYFMVETEKMTLDADTGRKVKTKIMEYEYEAELEDSYRASLVKSFKKQVDDGFFPFIIVDCVNNKVDHFSDIVSHAKKNGFEVYIGELEVDQSVCFNRNTHSHSREHIERIIASWVHTPTSYTKVDLTSLAQESAIEEVEMEDLMETTPKGEGKMTEEEDEGEEDEKETFLKVYNEFIRSKWDTMESQEDRLDKLDGVKAAKKKMGCGKPKSIEDWLQLSDDYDTKVAQPGKKRVRWADVEESKKQTAARERGFVLGQTDWNRMTDLSFGSNALVQIRYIEGRENK